MNDPTPEEQYLAVTLPYWAPEELMEIWVRVCTGHESARGWPVEHYTVKLDPIKVLDGIAKRMGPNAGS